MSGFHGNQSLKFGILDLSLYMEHTKKIIEDVTKFFSRHYKSVNFVGLTQDKISTLNFTEELPEEIDLLVYPTVLDLLTERVQAIGKPIGDSSLFMLANTPKSISLTTLEKVTDNWTLIGITASIIIISFLIAFFEFVHNWKLMKQLMTKQLLSAFLNNMWDSTMIFFCEPFGILPRRDSQRIICGIWILSCFVILCEVCGAMQSKYSFVSYNHIKDVDEIIPGSTWQPRTVVGQSGDRLLQLRAIREPKFQYVFEKLERFEPGDTADVAFYQDIKEEDVIFELRYILYTALGSCMVLGILEKEEMPLLYISKPIREVYLVHAISFKMSKDKKFRKIHDFLMNVALETKWMDSYDAQNNFQVETILWHPQTTETNTLALDDVIPFLKLFALGHLIAVLTLLFELIISYYTRKLKCLYNLKKPRLHYRR